MKVGDLVWYWPKWHPMEPSDPEGYATLLEFDDEEYKLLEGKPPNPKWEILFNGEVLRVRTYQVQEMNNESR